MKQSLMIAVLALAGLATLGGCCTSSGNPVADWQQERMAATQIAAKKGTPLTLEDVLYKSTLKEEDLAAVVNTFSAVSAGLYVQVVTGVDEMAVSQDGRQLYIGVQNDLAAGAKLEDLKAKMTPEEQAAYAAYEQMVAQEDQAKKIKTIVKPLIEQIKQEGEKLPKMVTQIKDDPKFRSLKGMQMVKESKHLFDDSRALSAQLGDAMTGATLWLQMLEKDYEAKQMGKGLDALVE